MLEPKSDNKDVPGDEAVEDESTADDQWRRFAYEQFMRDDDPEDAVYDVYQ